MFDEDHTRDLEDVWKQIQAAYLEAERCQNYHTDENVWTEIVRLVLKAAGYRSLIRP